MERLNQPIKHIGYLSQSRLLEINRDALRAMPKDERQNTCKSLIREVVRWSSYTAEEAIGILQSAQFHFLQQAEDIIEQGEAKEKKACKRIT
jgi:hypothetical protein